MIRDVMLAELEDVNGTGGWCLGLRYVFDTVSVCIGISG